jgi:hypothetical protein
VNIFIYSSCLKLSSNGYIWAFNVLVADNFTPFLLFRLLPKVLAWLLKRKFFIEVQIGRIGIPYLTLKDVRISKSGFSVVRIVRSNTLQSMSSLIHVCVSVCCCC